MRRQVEGGKDQQNFCDKGLNGIPQHISQLSFVKGRGLREREIGEWGPGSDTERDEWAREMKRVGWGLYKTLSIGFSLTGCGFGLSTLTATQQAQLDSP